MIFIFLTGEQRQKLYLSYVNDFFTIESFADHYGTDLDHTINFLKAMKEVQA